MSTGRPVATPMVPQGGDAVAAMQVTPEKVSKKRKVEEAIWNSLLEEPQKNKKPAGDPLFVDLGNNKTVRVRKFEGNIGIDIRAFWKKDGEMQFTKKGIWLNPKQFEVIVANAEAIRKAVDELK